MSGLMMFRFHGWAAASNAVLRKTWHLAPVLAVALAIVGASSSVSAEDGSAPMLQRNHVSVDGQDRGYYYFVPRSVDPRGFNLVVYALQDDHETVQQFAVR